MTLFTLNSPELNLKIGEDVCAQEWQYYVNNKAVCIVWQIPMSGKLYKCNRINATSVGRGCTFTVTRVDRCLCISFALVLPVYSKYYTNIIEY